MRILTIFTGVFLVIAAIWCVAHPGASFLSLAFILGLAMLIQGITCVLSYLAHKNRHGACAWILAEGIVTFILACIVLANQLVTDAVVPMFFGMWILFSGTMRTVASITYKHEGDRGWLWTLILGALSLLAGMYAFLNPMMGALSLGMLIGIFFLLQGINILIMGIMMPSKSKKRRREEEK